MIDYVVNPHLSLKLGRSGDTVSSLSLSAPVAGSGLRRTELRRGAEGRALDAMVGVLANIRRAEFRRSLEPSTCEALIEAGVLVPATSLSSGPRFECTLAAASGAPASELLSLRARDVVSLGLPEEAGGSDLESRVLGALARPAESCWIKDALTQVWLPYTVAPETRASVGRVLGNDGLIADLGPTGAMHLAEPLGLDRRWQVPPREVRLSYGQKGHCSLSGLLPAAWRNALAAYYASLVAGGFWPFDDGQSARYWVHNEPLAQLLNRQLGSVFSQIVGTELKSSYAYSCWYTNGATLGVHTDRPQCEYTASMLIDTNAENAQLEPWPLGIIDPRTKEISRYVQREGDTVLFEGTRWPHFRERQPEGRFSTCVFFHYVKVSFTGPLS